MRVRRRGVVLVISLVLTVVMVMFLGASLALGPGNLRAGQATLYQGQSQRAAESGMSYAIARLRQNSAWKGNANAVTVNRSDLYVVEDNGNVVGLVKGPDGNWSRFRLRFNYQDGGSPGDDGLADPTSLTIPLLYVSENNLSNGAPANVYRADGPGYSVTAASPVAFQTPIWSVCLAVEGASGPACSVLTTANPNANIPGAYASVVEAIYQVPDMGPNVQESGSMSGSDFLVTLRPGSPKTVDVTSKTKGQAARVRSKGNVEVTGGTGTYNYVSPKGEVRVPASKTFNASYDNSSSNKVNLAEELAIDPFYQLEWAKVKRSDSSTPNKMAAGTYVWWQDGSLHYYDMSYDDYVAFITQPANTTNPGVSPPPLPAAVEVDPSKHKLTLTDSVYVDPTGRTTDEFNVVARLGSEEAPPGDPEAAPADAAAIAGYLYANPTQLASFLASTQPSSWESDLCTPSFPGGLDFAGTGGSITDQQDPSQWPILLQLLMGQTVAGYSIESDEVAGTDYYLVTPDQVAQAGWYTGPGAGGTGGGNNGVIPVPGVADTLTAADLEIEFKPGKDSLAVLSSEGSMRITSAIKGSNGSITTGGDLRITGLGAKFSASSQQSGVNMYARGDITFSTLDQKSPGVYDYRDVDLKGVIYTQGNFTAKLGSAALPTGWGKLKVQGCLVAYGGDPASQAPGANGKGTIDVRGEEVQLLFDSAYLGSLSSTLPANFQLQSISWTNAY